MKRSRVLSRLGLAALAPRPLAPLRLGPRLLVPRPALLLLAVALLATSACGGAAGKLAAAPRPPEDAATSLTAFRAVEDDALEELAAIDRRLALRCRIEPGDAALRRVAMGAVLAEDASLAAVDGAIDPFSFDARGRGLARVKEGLASTRAPGTKPRPTAPTASAPEAWPAAPAALEREVLARLVDAELVRLDEEHALPRSASALVRGVVETWSPPSSPQQAAERDRWLTRRLEELRAAVSADALDDARARELDDALDALERAIEAAGLGRATGALVKLREALESPARPAANAGSSWAEVERGVRAHLGFALTPEALDGRLRAIEATLRTAAEGALAKVRDGADAGQDRGGLDRGGRAGERRVDAALARGARFVFASTPCAFTVPGSRVRSMAPPPERAAACRLQQLAAAADDDDAARAAALVAMHDHVVVAQWALDVARGAATLRETSGRHRPLSRPEPEAAAQWERLALVRPTAAIGGGLAAGVLFGSGDLTARARAWAALGEVPLDIAERELARRPLDGAPR